MESEQNESYFESYDVIVIGAGHAGCEAALAASRKGLKTLMTTIHLDSVALMPCNPSVGGTGKGHLVREIDALGGQMGKTIDETYLSVKMLNTAKGPAVRSLRAQADKNAYHAAMKRTLEDEENLTLKQEEAVRIIARDGKVEGIACRTGMAYGAKAIVVCTGTYLNSAVFIGHETWPSGPSGLAPSMYLSDSLRELGFELIRLKTGTPPRLHARSVDVSVLEPQYGDNPAEAFSFENDGLAYKENPCYLAYTNAKTHEIIRANLGRSALFSGNITGVGPRYCPSIEDKVVRFADKERHQIFLEPEGAGTRELYLQGMSTSLPEDVQVAFVRSLAGFEKAEITRPAYAIEYDAIHASQLKLSLESRAIFGLFFAGQINGTSGYEEAAAQGLLAGINAACSVLGQEALVLDRSQAYIGVLIDDIVSKDNREPYRIMTSRVEYRLLLRQDNADLRLSPIGFAYGLVSAERYGKLLEKESAVNAEKDRLSKVKVVPSDTANAILSGHGTSPLASPSTLYELIRRPQLDYGCLAPLDPDRPGLPDTVVSQVQIQIKYENYIAKSMAQVEQFRRMESRRIPDGFDYSAVHNLRTEAQIKLSSRRPDNLGQASRISGVSPSDVNALLIALTKTGSQDKENKR